MSFSNPVSVELVSQNCSVCGVEFAMPMRLRDGREASKTSFYCPNGHALTFLETTEDRLRKELRTATEVQAYWRELAIKRLHRSLRFEQVAHSLRGQITKLKKRAAK